MTGDGIEVKLTGVSELLTKLQMLGKSGEVVVRRQVRRALVEIEAEAKVLAPNSPRQPPTQKPSKSKGVLRGSISHKTEKRGLAGRVGTNVEYAPYQEFGTRSIPARPFLLPAFEMVRPKFVAALVADLQESQRRVAAGGSASLKPKAGRAPARRDSRGRFVKGG
jgi:HK97 gp10 family phage protein